MSRGATRRAALQSRFTEPLYRAALQRGAIAAVTCPYHSTLGSRAYVESNKEEEEVTWPPVEVFHQERYRHHASRLGDANRP